MRSRAALLAFLGLASAAGAQATPSPDQALARRCDSQIPWITDGIEIADGTTAPPEGAADRLALLERAKASAREKSRLVLWYCPRVPGTHMNRAAVLDTYARIVFFTDPGVTDLIRAKFVPLRLTCDAALSAATGVRMPRFVEPGFIVLTPDGKIVHTLDRIRTFNADWLRAALVEVLRRNGPFNAPVGDSVDDLMRGGDDEKALDRATAEQKAVIFRRLGRHREILELECAAAHKGRALLALGDPEGAIRLLGKDATPEGLYARSAAEVWTARDPEGTWKELIERHPDSPWAWRAAAHRTLDRDGLRRGPMTHFYEDVSAAPPRGTVTTTGERAADVETAARRAVDFLLRAQREDGSWSDSRYSYGWAKYMIRRKQQEGTLDPAYVVWPDPTLHPNLFVAITGLCGLALAERREDAPARIDEALRKAEAYLADDARLAPGKCEECFAELARLLFFTHRKDVARMNHVVSRLGRLQDADGFWGHEYPSAFATGAIVRALVVSRRAGADVPEVLLGRAADALLKTRRDGGRQDYRHEPGKPQSSEKNSAGRTALCELALRDCGRGSLEAVAAGVEVYWKHLAKLEAIRACDNHADEELAGFFFFYAMYHTLEAARALDEPARGRHLERFRDRLLPLAEIDGTFVDSHELGKSYGTAMALLMLTRLR